MFALNLDETAPWKQRFRVHRNTVRLAAANSARGLIASNRSGLLQLYAWDLTTGAQRQLTHRPAGTLAGFISPDGRYVYYLDDHLGDERGHFVRVPFEGGPAQDVTPDLPPYATWSIAFSRSGTLCGFTLPGPNGFGFYLLDLHPAGDPGTPREIYRNPRFASGPILSHDGDLAAWDSTERSGTLDSSVLVFDARSGSQVAELWDGEGTSVTHNLFCPLAGDPRLLATSTRGGLKRPLVWDPRTGERSDLPLDALQGEIEPWDWSPDGGHILLRRITNAVQQLYIYDLASGTVTRLQHPVGTFDSAVFGPHDDIVAQWQDASHAPQVIALDRGTGRQTRILLPADTVPPGRPWRSITFPSSDGQQVQGWLAVPEGAGPFPCILHTHGGPTAAQLERFSPAAQAWLDHGFAFLTINYRGSTTFGRDFERQIWGDVGHWEVEDMAAARRWLVADGIARPDQILLTGWSYGGYLTLQALGTHPDLWAGGMAGVVVADWITQYEDESEILRGYDVALFGGTPQEKPDLYAAASPITYVDRLRAPVLIIQGRNDTRDPPRQVELYEAKARALGKHVEVHWFETGHAGAFADVALAIAHQELMLRFAQRVVVAPSSSS